MCALLNAPARAQSLLKGCTDLLDSVIQESLGGEEPQQMAAKREKIASLSSELGAYLYHSATLLEFFGEKLDGATLKEAERSRALDQLARARQYLAINSRIARSIITDFRVSYKMEVPKF